MTTRIGRPSRADKPRVRIGTIELLQAVADLGPNWPVRFSHYEIVEVNEALDRELMAGTLTDAITLSAHGRRMISDVEEASSA
ncbi:MAG TPA: hypothetical protein VIJ71_00990 [Mycobacteriales bacterium]